MLYHNLSVNDQGHLAIAGMDACELAATYGTPLYVLDEDLVRSKCRTYVQAMRACLPEGSMPLFASKALCFRGIYPVIDEEGMGADCFLIRKEQPDLLCAELDPRDLFGNVGYHRPCDMVFVNGQLTVKDGHLMKVDEERLYRQGKEEIERLLG